MGDSLVALKEDAEERSYMETIKEHESSVTGVTDVIETGVTVSSNVNGQEKRTGVNTAMHETRIPILDKSASNAALKTAEYIRDASFEYSYFVIASPSVKRKMPDRRSSFASNSSNDTAISTPMKQEPKRSRNSKALLETMKKKLQSEIAKIDLRICKMEAEKLVLLNLRNSIMTFRNLVSNVERNKQNIPIAEKLRPLMQSILEKIQSENQALQKHVIPHLDDIATDLLELGRICNIIIENKSSLLISCVEEFFGIVGKLFGMIESVLLLFYEDELDDLDSLNEWDSKNTSFNSEEHDKINLSVYGSEFLETKREEDIPVNGEKEKQLATRNHFKTFIKQIGKSKKLFNVVERLSSGTPKMKTLCYCFKQIHVILGEYIPCGERGETVFQEMSENFIKLKEVLTTERPGEKELEKSKLLLGELSGRIKILTKNDILDM